MEQTLGKRIAENRKKLGLTQDQLAEKLGITAQAVSKWENDQSCPDITVLPRLADIFGISTDALLGRGTACQAEVVSDEPQEEAETGHNHWEFHWDAGRSGSLSVAILVLLVGGLMLASRLLCWDVSFWDILWPSALLVFGLNGVFKNFSFFRLGAALFGAYYLVENLGFWKLNLAGDLIFPIVILVIGLSLLADALKKPKGSSFRFVQGSGESKESKVHYTSDGETFDCSTAFGDQTRLINLPRLSGGEISCAFSQTKVDLSGCGQIVDGCEIEASCAFGSLTLLVPRQYRVEEDTSTFMANFTIEGTPDPNPVATIALDASGCFGDIKVQYI